MKVGDIVKLNCKDFHNCPIGTIVKVSFVNAKIGTYRFIHNGITYSVAEFELLSYKEKVEFT